MRLTLRIVVVPIVACFALVRAQANVTSCSVKGEIARCKFNASQLNLATESDLQLLDKTGKTVKCSKLTTKNGWYGEQCDGNARDANFIQRKNRAGIFKVFGSIRIGTDICRIQPNATGTEEMTCTPETDFPPEGDVLEPPMDDKDDSNGHVRNLPVGFDPTTDAMGGATDAHGRRLYDDSGANIDILVVWTKNAECANSGLSAGCTLTATTESNMRGLIDLAVEETNTAYALSGILSSLRLVYAYRDSTYVEPTSFRTALSNLRSRTDGNLDQVHAKRNLYGADLVQMIIGTCGRKKTFTICNKRLVDFHILTSHVCFPVASFDSANTEFCGIAYTDSGSSNAFAVISSKCATGYYSFGHEIGHNFGMLHDRGTEDSCTKAGYNFGYRSPTAAFRSILAYDCAVGQCDNMPKNRCTRVQRFSNNQYLYNGEAMGNASNNNALQFNSLRARIASYFPAMNCQSNGQCNDNDVSTLDTCDVAKAVCVFTPIPPPAPAPVFNVPTPTTDPMPEKCGLFGLSLFCPYTLCGVLGRFLGVCSS
jgi:Metallo-peptidase family M12B Reprolysin-like